MYVRPIVAAATLACFALSPAFADNVALLINDDYVDYSEDGGLGSEAQNLENQIPPLGHTVTSFTSVEAMDLENTLVGQDALVIPELEGGENLSDDLGAAGRTVISDFVNAGGNLVVFVRGGGAELVDDIFGFALVDDCDETRDGTGNQDSQEDRGCRGPRPPKGGSDEYFLVAANAAGNTFGGGPPSLMSLNATNSVSVSSLPGGSLPMYSDLAEENTVVAALPSGAGWIILYGWDWYQDFDNERGAAGTPEEVADWNDALDRGIRFPGGDSVLAVPMSPYSLLLLALALLSGGAFILRRQ